MSNSYFNRALSDFTHEIASAGAIRHLADRGFTVYEIADRLDYPTPISKIAETVYRHYLESGVICIEKPESGAKIEKVSYIKEYDNYNRASFRRVVELIDAPRADYIACDFGKEIYRDKEGFERSLSLLTKKEKDYIMGIPWPLERVYHIKDARMSEIARKLSLI